MPTSQDAVASFTGWWDDLETVLGWGWQAAPELVNGCREEVPHRWARVRDEIRADRPRAERDEGHRGAALLALTGRLDAACDALGLTPRLDRQGNDSREYPVDRVKEWRNADAHVLHWHVGYDPNPAPLRGASTAARTGGRRPPARRAPRLEADSRGLPSHARIGLIVGRA